MTQQHHTQMLEMSELPNIIELNVGGTHMTSKLSTLRKDPDSTLAAVFTGKAVIDADKDGRYFIDCEGNVFKYILEFLRFGKVPPSDKALDVYGYAKVFKLQELITTLEKYYPVQFQNRMRKVFDSLGENKCLYEELRNKVLTEIGEANFSDKTLIPLVYILNDADSCGKNHSMMVSSQLATLTEVKTLTAISDKRVKTQTLYVNDAADMSKCLAHDLCELGYCKQGFYFDSLSAQNCRYRSTCGFSWKLEFVLLSRNSYAEDKRLKRP